MTTEGLSLMIDQPQDELIGRRLRTRDGDKVGSIAQVYMDDFRDEPEWVVVDTGALSERDSFVPLSDAQLINGEVVVPYTRRQIRDAPAVAAAQQLTEAEEEALYAHYDIACGAFFSPPDPVVSGLPYTILDVAGQPPSDLDQFAAATGFTIDNDGPHRVTGAGSRSGDVIRFHEKDHGSGKDVRVWHVTQSDDGTFVAEHIAAW